MLTKTKPMKKLTFITLISLLFFSCSTEPEEVESTKLGNLLEKVKNGKGDEINIDELKDAMADLNASYQISDSKAKFKLTFPTANVKESTTIQLIDDEEVEIFHYTANMEGRDHINLAYQLDYIFLPDINSKEDVKSLFDEQRDYLLSAVNGKLEFEKIITKNDAPGRHLYLTIDESDLKTNYKMFFKNGIFYKLAVVTEEGHLFNKSIRRFFDSFKITD